MTPDLALWRRRVPVAMVSVVTAVLVVALMIGEVVLEPPCVPADPCRYPLGSADYLLGGPAQIVTLAIPALAFLLPRTALWATVVVGLVFAGPAQGASNLELAWLCVAVLLAGLALWQMCGRRRQRRFVESWAAPHQLPKLPASRLSWTQDTRALAVVVAALLTCTAVALVGVHDRQLDDIVSFESAAQRVQAVVVSADPDGATVFEVDGGRYAIALPVETYREGEVLPARLDPSSGRFALVAEPNDPSWLLGLAALAVVVAVPVLRGGWLRGSRRLELVGGGGPSVRLWLSDVDDLNHSSSAGDRPGGPVAFTSGYLWPVETAFRGSSSRPGGAGSGADGKQRGRDDDWDEDLWLWADEMPGRWADQEDDDEDDQPETEEMVSVIGQLVDGYPLLVDLGNGDVLISGRAMRDPWLLRRLPRLLFRRLRRNRIT